MQQKSASHEENLSCRISHHTAFPRRIETASDAMNAVLHGADAILFPYVIAR